MLKWYRNLTKSKKVLFLCVLMISAILLITFVVNITSLFIYWVDKLIDFNEINSSWIEFWGSLFGAFLSGLLLYITVKMTIENSRMEHTNNVNELKMNRNLGVRPLITFQNFEESERLIIVRNFAKKDNILQDMKYCEILRSNIQVEEVNLLEEYFTYKNIGLGPAIDIELTIQNVTEINGVKKFSDVLYMAVEDIYANCSCNYFEFQKDGVTCKGSWPIYSPFSLSVNSEKHFSFNYSSNVKEMYFMVILKYKDILGNRYVQKHLFAVDIDNYMTKAHTISQQEPVL